MAASIATSDVVADALRAGRPVVALETTLVTHGLPQPDGLRVAAALEAAVRDGGAIPATIGILDGLLRIGLSAAELTRLAETPGVVKVNPGNMAALMASGGSGSTTVAASLFAAARAAAMRTHFDLGLPGGVVVANPIPAADELPAVIHDAALATALAEAAAAGLRGRDVTPFLLERMRVLTGGASLRANEALLLHNARLAAQVAVMLAGQA